MPWVFGKLDGLGIRICECGEITGEDQAHWHYEEEEQEVASILFRIAKVINGDKDEP